MPFALPLVTLFSALFVLQTTPVWAETPEALFERMDAYPHADNVESSITEVVDHEVGLGAIQKSDGSWRFKHSERLTGKLTRYTWQVKDGYTSKALLNELERSLSNNQLLFSCDGRSCGPGVQWANWAFGERILYGRDDAQSYRVYAPAEDETDSDYRVLLFNASRTASRQYLHAEVLRVQTEKSQLEAGLE